MIVYSGWKEAEWVEREHPKEGLQENDRSVMRRSDTAVVPRLMVFPMMAYSTRGLGEKREGEDKDGKTTLYIFVD